MTDVPGAGTEQWLVVNVLPHQVRMAMADPCPPHRLWNLRSYGADQFPTFSYALEKYAKELEIRLIGKPCAISVCGAVDSRAIRITNGRWLLSPDGLRHLFDNELVILNNVGAALWATRTLPREKFLPLAGAGEHAPLRAGKRVMVWVDDGLGVSGMIAQESGQILTIGSEGGHIRFAPGSVEEIALADAVQKRGKDASYELLLGLAPDDPAWDAISPRPSPRDIERMRARWLGEFANAAALMFGAWEGVYLLGSALPGLSDPDIEARFVQHFRGNGPHRQTLLATPCWQVASPDVELSGAAAALAEQFRVKSNA